MVLANFGDFLKGLRQSWTPSRPLRRKGSHRRDVFVAAATECLEVRVVPAAQPTVSITPAVTVVEGDSSTQQAVFTVTLSAATTDTVLVSYATENGSASEEDHDYVEKSGTLSFSPGETSKTISVTVNGDLKFETPETFTVNLIVAQNAKLARNGSVGTATITNDDAPPTISITGPTNLFEGNSGTQQAVFTMTLSNPSSQPISVHYATEDGTATVANNDYEAASGTVTFAPGETTQTITVTINGDTTDEDDETFDVTLTAPSPSSSTITTATATATIGDDDTLPLVSVNNPAPIDEGDSGTVTLLFTVTLSSASTDTVTVAYATADGTATAGTDYTAVSGTLTFAPGQTTKEISVVVKGDSTNEAHETILLQLSSPTNARVGISPGTATITDDDEGTLPTVSMAQGVSVVEGDDGTVDLVFHVKLSQASGQTVTVAIATADGTAKLADNDYLQGTGTVTFAPGETDKTFIVKVNGDTKLEGNETLTVTLSNAENANIGTASAIGTITNDDGGTVSITGTRDGAETTPVTNGRFTVSLSGVSSTATVISYTVAGTAEPGDGNDYEELSGTVTIPAGQMSAVIDVTPLNDDQTEGPETVIVTLTEITDGAEDITLDPDEAKLTATIQIVDSAGLPSLSAGNEVTFSRRPIKILPEAVVGDTPLGGGTLSISVDAVVDGNLIVDTFRFPKIRSLGTTEGFQYVNNKLVITIDLKDNITAAAIQKFLRGLKFSTRDSGLDVDTRSFVVTLANAANQASSVTQTINVDPGS